VKHGRACGPLDASKLYALMESAPSTSGVRIMPGSGWFCRTKRRTGASKRSTLTAVSCPHAQTPSLSTGRGAGGSAINRATAEMVRRFSNRSSVAALATHPPMAAETQMSAQLDHKATSTPIQLARQVNQACIRSDLADPRSFVLHGSLPSVTT
jgi:hypothetical protein